MSVFYPATFLYSQLLVTPQLPDHDFSGQTVIVSGSNTGLGLEAARHFLRLHCAKLIIAVRNTSKGESARESLLPDTAALSRSHISASQIEVWPLDLASTSSVRSFAHRASTSLERVDVLVENAGVNSSRFRLSEEGWESTLQTNVLSTCLLAVLMLPKMRETGARFKTTPHLEVVTSDLHYVAKFPERHAEEGILKALNVESKFNESDRYQVTKTLQILFIRQLSHLLKQQQQQQQSPSQPPSPHDPVLTLPTPGACHSSFFRDLQPPNASTPIFETLAYYGVKTLFALFARKTEVGARTLVAGACAGPEADGQFMMDGVVRAPAGWIETDEGKRVQGRVFAEIMQAIGVKEGEILGDTGR